MLVPVQEAQPVTGRQRQDLYELLEAAAQGPRPAVPPGSWTEGRSSAPATGSHGSPDRAEPLWLVVTSANTVRALHRLALETHGRGLGELLEPGIERGLRVAAVGPATAAELESHTVPVHLQPHRTASAAGLLETWARPEGPNAALAPVRPGTVLLPQSAAACTAALISSSRNWAVSSGS